MTRKAASDPTLTPQDRRLIDRIAAAYEPNPMDAARAAAFRRRLAARLEPRPLIPWRTVCAVAATAVAAAVLWLVVPYHGPSAPQVASQPEAPLLYAFVDPDDYGGDRLQPADFLPDDYVSLAGMLNVPVDDL